MTTVSEAPPLTGPDLVTAPEIRAEELRLGDVIVGAPGTPTLTSDPTDTTRGHVHVGAMFDDGTYRSLTYRNDDLLVVEQAAARTTLTPQEKP